MVWRVGQMANTFYSIPIILILLILVMTSFSTRAMAQTSADRSETLPEAPLVAEASVHHVSQWKGWNVADDGASIDASGNPWLIKRFAGDQKAIWSSPLRLRKDDATWALPTLAGMGAFLASDAWFARQVPASHIADSRSLSNYGAYSLVGAAGGMYLFGKLTRNDHAAETGFLAGEAAVNVAVVDFALKSAFQRQRPYKGSGSGSFFAGGSSFPSEHASVSWAIAGVVAHEYPGTLSKALSYGLASAVSVARVTGKEHFPSDVLVGGALGYFIARQIYQRRRDPEVSAAAWESPIEVLRGDQYQPSYADKIRSPRNMGSAPVPPGSWVYPLFERLAAMGYIRSAYLGIRPWTRLQCARFLEEAGEALRYQVVQDGVGATNGGDEAEQLYTVLSREFAEETQRLDGAANLGAKLDSMYERSNNISGPPLTDGYHFAQTLIDDYGRPYGRGFNQIVGVSGHADDGMLSFSFQGEYQNAPALASYSTAVQQAISQVDEVPAFANGTPAINRLQIIGSSLSLTYHDLEFSLGKQAEWLGPGESGPFLASTNAPSILMFQIKNVTPISVPLLGPAQSVFYVGQLAGQTFVYDPPNILGPGFHPQPFIHGNKISFKPTANLEFGMGMTAIFGGPGLPFTFGEFFRSYYSHKSNIADNPAKRFSGFDISYRVPGLRKWLTVYNDSLVGDEISPIGSTRPMLSPGLYMAQVPKIPKLELRFEGVKDPFTNEFLPGFIYYDRRYRSGYTNGGNLIGSWVGRDGFGAQAQATYWFAPQTKLQWGYRYQEADRNFLEGGRLADYSLRAETKFSPGFTVSGFLQYEQWTFPLLAASRQSNVTSSLQLMFYPHGQR